SRSPARRKPPHLRTTRLRQSPRRDRNALPFPSAPPAPGPHPLPYGEETADGDEPTPTRPAADLPLAGGGIPTAPTVPPQKEGGQEGVDHVIAASVGSSPCGAGGG